MSEATLEHRLSDSPARNGMTQEAIDALCLEAAQRIRELREGYDAIDCQACWALKQLDEARAVLREIEFCVPAFGHPDVCPICEQFQLDGHAPECRLAKELRL